MASDHEMKPGEAIAMRVLEAMLPGAKLTYRLEQSHREYDFDLLYSDGTAAAVEVTMAVDEGLRKTSGDIRGRRDGSPVIPAVACKQSWSIYAAKGVDIRPIRRKADQLLANLEREGVNRFEYLDQWKPGCSEAVRELCEHIGVTEGHVFSSSGKPAIRINSPIRGSAVGDSFAIIQAGEACMEANREKMSAAEATERHLVVYFHPLSNPHPSNLIFSEPPKDTFPKLSKEFTNIWFIGDGRNENEFIVWWAGINEPWRSTTVTCA